MSDRISNGAGFLAALDQSGGSTPNTLNLFGIPDADYVTVDKSMYDAVHRIRTRVITSPSFSGDKVLGAILFQDTMDRVIDGLPTAEYIWEKKRICPFLTIDVGLMDESNGVQLMKPIPGLDELLQRGKAKGMYGTKMRSVIKDANPVGIRAIVAQQLEIARLIFATGLIPIVEPEVDINSPTKVECDDLLKAEILAGLDKLGADEKVIFKLAIPSKINHYRELMDHPKGGYSRDEASKLLSKQTGMIASFSRALLEGLNMNRAMKNSTRPLPCR